MSLVVIRGSSWQRQPQFQVHEYTETNLNYSKSSSGKTEFRFRTSYDDPERDDVTAKIIFSHDRTVEGTAVERKEKRFGTNEFAETHKITARSTVQEGGEVLHFTAIYTTETVTRGGVVTIRTRTRIGDNPVVDVSTSFTYESAGTTQAPHSTTSVSTLEYAGTRLEKQRIEEVILGVRERTRFDYRQEVTTADFFTAERETAASTSRVAETHTVDGTVDFTYEKITRASDSFTRPLTFRSKQARIYYRTTADVDQGEKFWLLRDSVFTTEPKPFASVFRELGDKERVEWQMTRTARTYAIVTDGAEPEEQDIYRVSAYTKRYHVPDDGGGWKLVSREFEEWAKTSKAYEFVQHTYLYTTHVTRETRMLSRVGDYASRIFTGQTLMRVTATTDGKTVVPVRVGSSDEASTNNDTVTAFYTESSREFEGGVWYTTIEATNRFAESRDTTSAYVPISGITEEVGSIDYGAAEILPFEVALAQETRTPGFVPFGDRVTNVLFATFSSSIIATSQNRLTQSTQYFVMPEPRLNGEIRAGQRKMDLSDREWSTKVYRPQYSVSESVFVQAGASALETESVYTLERRATVRQRWELPAVDATTHTIATLHMSVRDAEGFVSTRTYAFALGDRIPTNQHTGHTILEMADDEWAVIGAEKDATLYFGRCELQITWRVDGEEKVQTITATSNSEITATKGVALAVKRSRLWQNLGTFWNRKVIARGNEYLR